jgi:hypothetical protein
MAGKNYAGIVRYARNRFLSFGQVKIGLAPGCRMSRPAPNRKFTDPFKVVTRGLLKEEGGKVKTDQD